MCCVRKGSELRKREAGQGESRTQARGWDRLEVDHRESWSCLGDGFSRLKVELVQGAEGRSRSGVQVIASQLVCPQQNKVGVRGDLGMSRVPMLFWVLSDIVRIWAVILRSGRHAGF